ncbi:uncharacterized protein [Medicago truncatula]|uniref:uncharacterized protein n=1 Tax=Medicago truncatula TaxID=3880 RepID=UPI0019688D41|nr:uncharacterized protein LOC120579517 [Medicago truncatula]
MTIDAAAGGALMDKPFKEAYELIQNMAQNHYQSGSERTPVEKSQSKGGMHEVSNLDHMNAKVDALFHKLDNLKIAPPATVAAVTPNCEIWGTPGHVAAECLLLAETDQVNYAQGNPYTLTPPPGFQGQRGAPVAPKKSNLELMMENFVLTQTQQNKEFMNQNVHTNELIKQLAHKVDSMATHNKMLETQVSQVAQQQAATAAPTGTFPGQPQPNPKGHVNAVTIRSGTELDNSLAAVRVRSRDDGKAKDLVSELVDIGETSKSQEVTKKEKEKPYVPPPPYKPSIPYPQRLAKSKTESQFKKFVELLKSLHLSIPFSEAITQMPSYAKFLKEILTNKRKIDDNETVALTEECSAIIQNKMPPKLKDPRSFSITCVIGSHIIDKALCNLGASVSLIPLSICKKLNLRELKPTRMSLQLADRSIKHPVGIIEDVPLRIGQLYIPTDFVVMDISEDSLTPILLGRPFLATAGAIIDVKKGKLTFEVGDEKIEFILSQFMKSPSINDTRCFVDIIDACIKEFSTEAEPSEEIIEDPIEEVKEMEEVSD